MDHVWISIRWTMSEDDDDNIEPLSEWPPPCGGSPCGSDSTSTRDCHRSMTEAEAYSIARPAVAQPDICCPEPKKACHRKETEEPLANIGLARWWRWQRKIGTAVTLPEKEGENTTWNPNTLLRCIARYYRYSFKYSGVILEYPIIL